MTKEYSNFLDEYHATGRKKLDGYSFIDSNKITLEEKKDIIDKLKEEIYFFSGAIEPLIRLDKDEAIESLETLTEKQEQKKLAKSYQVFFWLWKLTNKEKYLLNFFSCLPKISESSKISYFTNAKSEKKHPIMKEIFRDAVLNEKDRTVRGIAAEALLEIHEILFKGETKENHRRIWKTLKDGHIEEKIKALSEI